MDVEIWLELLAPAAQLEIKHDHAKGRFYACYSDVPSSDVADCTNVHQMIRSEAHGLQVKVDDGEKTDCKDMLRLLKINRSL